MNRSISCFMLLLCSLAGFASDIRLTPAPKQLEVTSGQTAKFSYDWKIDNETDYNHAADWIEEEFSGRRRSRHVEGGRPSSFPVEESGRELSCFRF